MKIVSIDEVIESKKSHSPQSITLDRLFNAELQRKHELVETMRLQEAQAQEYQQAYQEEQAHQEEQAQEASCDYYYMMLAMDHEMDQISEAIDEETFDEADAWAEYLEQIEEECDFCEDNGVTTAQETFTAVDYSYVKMLECELAKFMS